MKHISSFWHTFWQDSEGVTAIEYALLASLIAVAVLSAIMALGDAVLTIWTRVSNCVTNPASCV